MLRIPVASQSAVQLRRRQHGSDLVSMPSRLPSISPPSADAIRSSKVRCGAEGILPIDSIELLAEARGMARSSTARRRSTGTACATRSKSTGMRNSNVMAIAPTATISNICGVAQSIEPTYQNLYVKSNMSGDFTVVNEFLVRDLKARGLWDEVMVTDLKYFDGSVGHDRPRSRRSQGALCHRLRDRQRLADRSRGAAAEMDRPVAVAQPLYRQALRQEARRALSAGLEARPEDDLLPAVASATHVEKSTLKGTDGKLNAVSSCRRLSRCERSSCRRPGSVLARRPAGRRSRMRSLPVRKNENMLDWSEPNSADVAPLVIRILPLAPAANRRLCDRRNRPRHHRPQRRAASRVDDKR